MKQTLATITFLMISFLSTYAQKEIFFNNTPLENIKVESLQGVEVNYTFDPGSILSSTGGNNQISTSNPLYIGYFYEKRISSEWTLNSTIGLYNVFGKRKIYELIKDSAVYRSYSYTNKMMNTYSLALEAGIEPRWYWGYKKRFQSGKAQLNSGFFLSFPLLFSTTLLLTPDPIFNPKWTPANFMLNVSFTPSVGYRQALSGRWYLEGSFGAGINSVIYKNYNNSVSFLSPNITLPIKLKAAYRFK